MQKKIIGALVAGLILFIWQFLSFGLLSLHGSQMQHTGQQDAILQALADSGLEEGEYFIPQAPPGSSSEAQQAEYEKRKGQPWAQIIYHKSLDYSMGMNMFRAFLVDFLTALLLIWILMQFAELNLMRTVYASLAIGLIGYLTINYLDSIWFETNSIPDLLDAVVGWGIVGAWLGWYLPR